MITSIILIGLGASLGSVVAIVLTSPKEDEINQRLENAKKEGMTIAKNELNNTIKQKELEINQLKQSKQLKNNIEIEEV